MSRDDLVRIRINRQNVGVIGLKKILEDMAKDYAERPDTEVETRNCVERIRSETTSPTLQRRPMEGLSCREFNKFLGRPFEEEDSEGLEIKVLGPGCDRCDQLEQDVMEVAAAMKLLAAVDHVRDIKEIAGYGVMGTPALAINGKVVSVGVVPTKEKIKDFLSEYS